VVLALIEQTLDDLAAAGVAGAVETGLVAQMRYRGQGSELPVAIDPADLAASDAAGRLAAAFGDAYQRLYKRRLAVPVEILAWSARSEIALEHAVPPAPAQRAGLAVGAIIDGPAQLTDTGTTIIVPAGWRAVLAPGGHLLLTRMP
jgi:N-methylhydantoinase A/oxoprolinase/acetone carboxylase beta subunit